MKIIPPVIHNSKSEAEDKVFRLLSNTISPHGQIAFHSLNIPEHQYKQWAEVDFIVIGQNGIIVLEIKGGHVSCKDGIWEFTTRFGKVHRKSEGPFKQVLSGMYALKEMLKTKFSSNMIKDICFGWGVIFPDQKFSVNSIEIPRETILDGPEFRDLDSLQDYLTRLSTYWHNGGGRKYDMLENSVIAKISNYLRPNFDLVPSLAAAIDQVVGKQVRLTEEQYQLIDCVSEAPRIICQGGAGTGKSFIAAEVARRESSSGKKVAFVCRSDVFTAFIRNRLSKTSVEVFTYEHAKTYSGLPFDVLVVDEGQDLLDFNSLAILGKILTGDLERGSWRFFMDPNNQAGLYNEYNQEALDFLKECGATPVRLKKNCRNTEQIVIQTMAVTGADIGAAIVEGKGQKVDYSYVDSPQDTSKELSRKLHEWLEGGARLGEVVILSDMADNSPVLKCLSDHWKRFLVRVDVGNACSWKSNCLPYCDITNFKGLENHYVAVIDLYNIDSSRKSIVKIYVAMTRANAVLWMAVPFSIKPVIDELRSQNLSTMLTHSGKSK